ASAPVGNRTTSWYSPSPRCSSPSTPPAPFSATTASRPTASTWASSMQVVRGYAAGRAPVVDLKAPGFCALRDHFHPILALLAPWYRLFPAAETLLVAQAALIAASVIPVGLAAARLLPPAGAAVVAVAYGLSWGLQEAIGFDFHEICFAVPL